MNAKYLDRSDAGRSLADHMQHLRHRPGLIVLALPRGGVPVAFEIAKALGAPLDIFLVRKLGTPGYEEFAFGAIASGHVRFVNEQVVERLGLSRAQIERVVHQQQDELDRREQLYRGDKPQLPIRGKDAILVDDGLATGASMHAAILALRQHEPHSITVAVPVGAPDTCAHLRAEVDELLCPNQPFDFQAVGLWYQNFAQTTDDEVCELLKRAHMQQPAARF